MKKDKTFGMSNWKKKILSNSGRAVEEAARPFLFSHNKKVEKYARTQKEAALQVKQDRTTNGESKKDIRGMGQEPTPATSWYSRNGKDIHKPLSGSKRPTRKK